MYDSDAPDLERTGPTNAVTLAKQRDLGSPERRIREARKQCGIALEQVRDDEQRSVVRHQIEDAEAKLQRALDQLEAIAAEEADA